ncbi:hypothetical protein B0A50_01490 [Salinomyces thailandicus]|uniref:Scytalone dehydratase-like domain-containing protein n=1 Tax=Salinomyces thailandicus TaxID=706561 RepID=A0A4U0UAY9_9PEZI|nr:hypothetical protein B0A50_01490 [Salinomyces thailandica]
MAFQTHIPANMTFQDFLAVIQISRILADGFDKKEHPHPLHPPSTNNLTHLQDPDLLRAALAPEVTADYTAVRPQWTRQTYTTQAFIDEWLGPNHLGSSKALITFHLLGMPYFTRITDGEIVVNYQQLACHARRAGGDDWGSPECGIEGHSDGKSWMEQTFVKVEGEWKIGVIRPSIHYRPGSLETVGRHD